MEAISSTSQAANDAHGRRVAAYCGEIATALAFGDNHRQSLVRAARLHHAYEEWVDELFTAKLFRVAPRATPPLPVGSAEAAILDRSADADPAMRQLSTILDLADQFDEYLEYAPFTEQSRAAMLDVSNPAAADHPAVPYVLSHLRGMRRADVASLTQRLPVFPPAAHQVLRVASDADVAVPELVAIANTEAVLSGTILQAANSALYGTRSPFRTVQQAVVFLGTDTTRRILLTAALKPLLRTSRLQVLWSHSIEAALTAQALARMSPNIDTDEAYTVSLLHDIGHVLLELVPTTVLERRERLRHSGVETAVAELVTCGASHAEAGADVVRFWQLPEDYATAIEFHHEPDRCDSVLAAMLYVVEFWTALEEDMPSNVRLHHALKQLRLTPDDLGQLKIGQAPAYLN